jgi:hypothetical protein
VNNFNKPADINPTTGLLEKASVQAQPGKSVPELVETGKLNNKKIGETTVGEVRAGGGDVIPDPIEGNPDHARLVGMTPEEAATLPWNPYDNPFGKDHFKRAKEE